MAQPGLTPSPMATGGFKPINTSTTIGAVASNPSNPAAAASSQPQISSPAKEVPMASLCRSGQEMVQEVVQKTTDIFKDLKTVHLPNGTTTLTPQMCQERRTKLEDTIRYVNVSFRKLLHIYDKVKEYKEDKPIEEYLPIEENGTIQGETPRVTESLVHISDEHKEIIEQIQSKNQQLKEIIDKLRMVIWEINTMMAVKRS